MTADRTALKVQVEQLEADIANQQITAGIVDDREGYWHFDGYRAALRALAALLDAETGTGWQPIETAPKDGSRVLIWAESPATGHRSVYVAWWAIPYEGATDKGWWETGLYGSTHPVVPQFTHGWQPLPAPPGAESGTEPAQEPKHG